MTTADERLDAQEAAMEAMEAAITGVTPVRGLELKVTTAGYEVVTDQTVADWADEHWTEHKYPGAVVEDLSGFGPVYEPHAFVDLPLDDLEELDLKGFAEEVLERKHLAGRHDQMTHGFRGGGKIDAVIDVEKFLRRVPDRLPGEEKFKWQSRIMQGLEQDEKSAVLARIREKYQPCVPVADAASRWRANQGLPEPKVNWSTVRMSLPKAAQVAAAYNARSGHRADTPEAKAAYADFRRQTEEMWDLITRPESEGGLGITVEFVTDPEPYESAEAQARDVDENRRIKITHGEFFIPDGHPHMSADEYGRFRAVHDVFGHVAIGGGFDRHGEYAAWLAHDSMYADPGRRAMSTEYHGTNSVLISTGQFAAVTGDLLPYELTENPWDQEGNLVRKSAELHNLDRALTSLGLDAEFANRYDNAGALHRAPAYARHPLMGAQIKAAPADAPAEERLAAQEQLLAQLEEKFAGVDVPRDLRGRWTDDTAAIDWPEHLSTEELRRSAVSARRRDRQRAVRMARVQLRESDAASAELDALAARAATEPITSLDAQRLVLTELRRPGRPEPRVIAALQGLLVSLDSLYADDDWKSLEGKHGQKGDPDYPHGKFVQAGDLKPGDRIGFPKLDGEGATHTVLGLIRHPQRVLLETASDKGDPWAGENGGDGGTVRTLARDEEVLWFGRTDSYRQAVRTGWEAPGRFVGVVDMDEKSIEAKHGDPSRPAYPHAPKPTHRFYFEVPWATSKDTMMAGEYEGGVSIVEVEAADEHEARLTALQLVYSRHQPSGGPYPVDDETLLRLIDRDRAAGLKAVSVVVEVKHGEKGEPGYELLHPPKPGFHWATDEERKKARPGGSPIPPAWTDVQISDDPTSPLQAIGKDSKGRVQPRYSAEHTANSAAAKWAMLKKLAPLLPQLDEALERDFEDPTAAAVLLMRHVGIRVGGEDDTGADKKAYGATTLQARHVTVNGNSVRFLFDSKDNQVTDVSSSHPLVVKAVRHHKKGKRGATPLFATSGGRTISYIKRATEPWVKNKDLRTWVGTSIAAAAVKKLPVPKSMKEYKAQRLAVGKRVAAALGNTPTVALGSYVNPAVFSRWDVALAKKAA